MMSGACLCDMRASRCYRWRKRRLPRHIPPASTCGQLRKRASQRLRVGERLDSLGEFPTSGRRATGGAGVRGRGREEGVPQRRTPDAIKGGNGARRAPAPKPAGARATESPSSQACGRGRAVRRWGATRGDQLCLLEVPHADSYRGGDAGKGYNLPRLHTYCHLRRRPTFATQCPASEEPASSPPSAGCREGPGHGLAEAQLVEGNGRRASGDEDGLMRQGHLRQGARRRRHRRRVIRMHKQGAVPHCPCYALKCPILIPMLIEPCMARHGEW